MKRGVKGGVGAGEVSRMRTGGVASWAEGRAHSCPRVPGRSPLTTSEGKQSWASGLPRVSRGMTQPKQAKEDPVLQPQGSLQNPSGVFRRLPKTQNRGKCRLWGAAPKQGLSTWGLQTLVMNKTMCAYGCRLFWGKAVAFVGCSLGSTAPTGESSCSGMSGLGAAPVLREINLCTY